MIHATKAALCVLRDGGRRPFPGHDQSRIDARACRSDRIPLGEERFSQLSAQLLATGRYPLTEVTCPRCAVFVDAALRKGGR